MNFGARKLSFFYFFFLYLHNKGQVTIRPSKTYINLPPSLCFQLKAIYLPLQPFRPAPDEPFLRWSITSSIKDQRSTACQYGSCVLTLGQLAGQCLDHLTTECLISDLPRMMATFHGNSVCRDKVKLLVVDDGYCPWKLSMQRQSKASNC